MKLPGKKKDLNEAEAEDASFKKKTWKKNIKVSSKKKQVAVSCGKRWPSSSKGYPFLVWPNSLEGSHPIPVDPVGCQARLPTLYQQPAKEVVTIQQGGNLKSFATVGW